MKRENFLIVDAVNSMYYNGMIDWVFNNSNVLVLAGGKDTEQSLADLQDLISQVIVPRRGILEGTVYFYRNKHDFGEISIVMNKVKVDKTICS